MDLCMVYLEFVSYTVTSENLDASMSERVKHATQRASILFKQAINAFNFEMFCFTIPKYETVEVLIVRYLPYE